MNYWWSGDIICCYSHLPFLCFSCSFNWIIISITFVSAFSICRLQCQCSWLRFRSSATNVGPFHYYLLLHNLFVFVGFILCISYSSISYTYCVASSRHSFHASITHLLFIGLMLSAVQTIHFHAFYCSLFTFLSSSVL